MTETETRRQIRRFAARVRRGQFFGFATQGLVAWVLVLACALLVLRLFDIGVEWRPWVAVGVLLPPIAWALWRLRRSGFARGACGVHLDRRLGLDGLLLASLERDPGPWATRIEAELPRVATVLPRPRPGRLLVRVGVAALVLAVLLLLPPPRGGSSLPSDPLGAEALDAFEQKLDELLAADGLREEAAKEIQERLDGVRTRFERDGRLSWNDLDALDEKLGHEQTLTSARLAKVQSDLAACAARHGADAAGAEARADLARALEAAREAGLLDDLPEEGRCSCGLDGTDGSGTAAIDAAGLSGDATTLRQLATALAQVAGDRLSDLAAAGVLEGVEPLDLESILGEETLAELMGKPCRLCSEGEGRDACPG